MVAAMATPLGLSWMTLAERREARACWVREEVSASSLGMGLVILDGVG